MIRVDVALKLGAFDLDVAFENDAGITALFGRSGSGKSMTINLIAGLARPDRGSIVLDGRVLVDTEAAIFVPTYRRRVGLVFQTPSSSRISAFCEISYSAAGSRRRARGRSPSIAWSRRSLSSICSSANRRGSPAAKGNAWPSAWRYSLRLRSC